DGGALLALRPPRSHCHYFCGDYSGPPYPDAGFECCFSYSRKRYDPIIVYERYEYRNDPTWERTQVNIFIGRDEGRIGYERPPRTLVQQNTIVQNTTIVQNNVTNITQVNQNNTVVNN